MSEKYWTPSFYTKIFGCLIGNNFHINDSREVGLTFRYPHKLKHLIVLILFYPTQRMENSIIIYWN
jgi:hypothetical protein